VLRLGHEPGDLRQLGVTADARRPHEQASARVHRRAGHGVAGADFDRDRLAGEQRGVDRRRPVLDDAVGRHLLARAHDEHVADRQSVDRHAALRAVAQHGDVLRAELEKGAQRGARTALGSCLEVAPGQDEHGHRARHFEIGGVTAGTAFGGEVEGHLHPRLAGVTDEQCVQRPAEGGQRAEGDQRVHRRGGVAQVEPCRPVERCRAPDHDRRGQRQREPLPVPELQRRHHGHGHHGRGQER
jgi:hypothetical protein